MLAHTAHLPAGLLQGQHPRGLQGVGGCVGRRAVLWLHQGQQPGGRGGFRKKGGV